MTSTRATTICSTPPSTRSHVGVRNPSSSSRLLSTPRIDSRPHRVTAISNSVRRANPTTRSTSAGERS